MQVIKHKPSGFGCNSYILTADGVHAVVIDCAEEEVYNSCISRGLTPVALLLTHGHFDHVGGAGKFFSAGVKIYCGEKEKEYIFSYENKHLIGSVNIPDFEIYQTLSDGQKLTLAGIEFTVIETPGHTPGSVCYIADDYLFTGDTLFRLSVGRCDLAGGNSALLKESLKKLFLLPDDYIVHCGHEGDTTLSFERRYNPYAGL